MNDMANPEELWTMQKGKLRLLFPHLHDEDFRYDYGKKDVMLELLQQKLGKTRDELNALLLTLRPYLPQKSRSFIYSINMLNR
jgi:hypothetical protein